MGRCLSDNVNMNTEQKKISLVTGATRGIGRAIAEKLALNGGTVIGTGTTEEGAANISAYLESLGANGEGVKLDITNSDDVTKISQHINRKYGKVSILVNNAGISRNSLLVRMREDEWDTVVDTNLKSVYRLCKTFVRGMMQQRYGRIINISSVVGAMGNIGQAHYAATKAGVIAFSKSLAVEVATRNITVNVVAPGFIETDMTNELRSQIKEDLLSNIPAGCMGTPEDVANAVIFLASPSSSYITGTTLYVDGGMVRR